MKELRSRVIIHRVIKEIEHFSRHTIKPLRIMEVCGTHTMAIHRYGLKELLLEAGIEMLSGPGCPVCITPNEIHEAAIDLVSQKENIILATFGDMTRVPTEKGSLQTTSPTKQSEIKIVYSPQEALDMARRNPHKEVIFFGAGFETTLPAIALTIHEAFIKKSQQNCYQINLFLYFVYLFCNHNWRFFSLSCYSTTFNGPRWCRLCMQ